MKKIGQQVTRRDILRGSLGGAVMLASQTGHTPLQGSEIKQPAQAKFYQANKGLCEKSAKGAYFAMMERFGYPIQDILKTDQFWVCDFLQRDFAKLGLGGIFWIKAASPYKKSGAQAYTGDFQDALFGYVGIEIYLLPGQMIPEHRHLGGNEGYGPKMESWLVRYGSVELFGEYPATGKETLISDMPEQKDPWGYGDSWFKCKYMTERTARSGQVYSLEDPESWHFMRAGAQGAIVTEYATCHNHIEFSKPDMEFLNSPAAVS